MRTATAGLAQMSHQDRATTPCRAASLWTWRSAGTAAASSALAGVRADTGESFTFARRRGLPQALRRLDELAQGADFLLGHNLIDFDLPHLSAANPNLWLSRLPTDQRHATSV